MLRFLVEGIYLQLKYYDNTSCSVVDVVFRCGGYFQAEHANLKHFACGNYLHVTVY